MRMNPNLNPLNRKWLCQLSPLLKKFNPKSPPRKFLSPQRKAFLMGFRGGEEYQKRNKEHPKELWEGNYHFYRKKQRYFGTNFSSQRKQL